MAKAKPGGKLKKEIYTYEAPWHTYAIAWSNRRELGKGFRLAVGSFKLEYSNVVNVSRGCQTPTRVSISNLT